MLSNDCSYPIRRNQCPTTAALANQSAQLTALQSQGIVQSQQLERLELLAASQNHMATEIDSTLDQQLQVNLESDRGAASSAHQSGALVYIPGLMK